MCLQHYQSEIPMKQIHSGYVYLKCKSAKTSLWLQFLVDVIVLPQFIVTIKSQIYLCLYVLLMQVCSLLGISSSFVCLFRFNLCFWPNWNVTLLPGQNKSLSPFAFPPHFVYNFNIVCYLLFLVLQLFIVISKSIRLYAFWRYRLCMCFLWHFLSFHKIYPCTLILSQYNIYRICPLKNTDLPSSYFDSNIYV